MSNSNFATTGKLAGLPAPTEAQLRKIQIVAGTLAGIIRDSHCTDMEAKAVLSNLILEFGTLEQYSEDQKEAFKNYKPKRYRKANNWRVR